MIETYGLTVSDITDLLPTVINDNTKPNTNAVSNMITASAAYVNGIARAQGISGVAPDSEEYQTLKYMVLYKTCSDVLAAKNSGTEQASYFLNRFNEFKEILLNYPRHIAEGSNPNRTRVIIKGGDSQADFVDPVTRKLTGSYGFNRKILVNP